MDPEEEGELNLPEIILFDGSDWQAYEDELYQKFLDSLVNKELTFLGLRIGVQKRPPYKGKHFAFWHLTSEGEKEGERTPDLRRCERILWVSWIIENCEKCQEIVFWENRRRANQHIVIWHRKENYAVILAKRKNYLLLKTAYLVTRKRASVFERELKASRGHKS